MKKVMETKYRVTLYVLVIMILSVIGCGQQFMPIATDSVKTDEEYGVLQTDDIKLIAANRYWNMDPMDVSEYYTTYYVIIKNRSDSQIVIEAEDLKLADEFGNQYDAFPDEEVLDFYEQRVLSKRAILYNDQNSIAALDENYTITRRNLMQKSFYFGKLNPGNQKSGFVFFRRVPSKYTTHKLQYKENEIEFKKLNKG